MEKNQLVLTGSTCEHFCKVPDVVLTEPVFQKVLHAKRMTDGTVSILKNPRVISVCD